MKDYIEKRIKQLREEISVIDKVTYENNLKQSKFDKQRVFDLRSKINILTEVVSNN